MRGRVGGWVGGLDKSIQYCMLPKDDMSSMQYCMLLSNPGYILGVLLDKRDVRVVGAWA